MSIGYATVKQGIPPGSFCDPLFFVFLNIALRKQMCIIVLSENVQPFSSKIEPSYGPVSSDLKRIQP